MDMSLARTDWIDAALSALAQDGLAGVAVQPLARTLGASKGSFYWHFADRAALVTATLELWEQRETTAVIERIEAIDDPRERLVALGRGAYAGAAQGNAHASVLAAASDPRVRLVLGRVTRTRLAFLQRLYRDLGLKEDEATRRARVAYALYLGIGELRRADSHGDPTDAELDAYLELALATMLPPGVPADAAGA
jgi:AcrR family transcriptional regulator